MKLRKLFEPTKIGAMTLKNRLVMAPMENNYGSSDGFVTPRLVDYYEQRAKGGVGLIIVQGTTIDYPGGIGTVRKLGIDNDRFLEGLSKLAKVIKRSGARAAIQLERGGTHCYSGMTGTQPVGPSAGVSIFGEGIKELTAIEIAELVDRYAKAAARAQKAGFDGVEIHGAHAHLLAEFLSSCHNQRQDRYGGSLENRARFLLEVIRACRAAVGPDYPLWCRINGIEYGCDNALGYDQAVQVARLAEEAGADAVSVSGYGEGAQFLALCPGMPGFHLAGAAAVKRYVKVPVIAVGRIYPELGEWALREEMADLIAIGRGLIADPYLPKKAAESRLEDIVPCLGCWECTEAIAFPIGPSKGDLRCAVNPTVGRERQCVIKPARSRKRVVVVGGGPAGMEAARVAKLRGHDVSLIEKESQLGGQLIAAAAPPYKGGISLLIDYLRTQLVKLGVKVKTGKEATLGTIAAARPDAVIWAAGAAQFVPDIPGIDQAKVVFASEVLTGSVLVGDKVVIIGAETVGCETANFLADQGKKVTVVRRGPQVMAKAGTIVTMRLLDDLSRKGVELLTGVKYEGFGKEGLVIRTEEGERRNLMADTYVLATGARPNSEPVPALKRKIKEVYVIGDSLEPRRIINAMTEGFEAGFSL